MKCPGRQGEAKVGDRFGIRRPVMNETLLYDRIGGEKAVDQIVGEMYRRILADDQLAPFFSETSMEKQMRMQTEFFCAALGGPIQYSGLDLAEVHRGRGITRQLVTRFVDHLVGALGQFDLSDTDVDEICARIGTYVNDVVGDSTSDG